MTPKFLKLAGVAFSACLLVGGLTGGASAHSVSNPAAVGNVQALSAAAQLVIRGKVTNVAYRVAPGASGSAGMPYTFVTYKISNVMQGASPGQSITLRFPGGPDGQGGFVDASTVPHFQTGDEDILFIAHNGNQAGCALVLCESGRYRIVNNAVYEASTGAPVLSVSGTRVVHGKGRGPASLYQFTYPAPTFDGLMKNPAFAASVARTGLSIAQARAAYNARAPKVMTISTFDSAAAAATRAAGAGLSADTFVSSLGSQLSAASRRQFTALKSASASAPLAAVTAAAAAPASAPRGAATVSPGPEIRKD